MTRKLMSLERRWREIKPTLTIRNSEDYDRAIALLNELLDVVGTDETHPLYEFLDTLAVVIRAYEEKHFQFKNITGPEALEFLMEEHALRQSDLPEIGSQGVISEILNGKRTLNVRQIKILSERFGVSPAVFF